MSEAGGRGTCIHDLALGSHCADCNGLGDMLRARSLHDHYLCGAAAAFTFMGMALAIKENHDPWYRCAECGSHSLNSGGKCLSSMCDVDLRDRSADR